MPNSVVMAKLNWRIRDDHKNEKLRSTHNLKSRQTQNTLEKASFEIQTSKINIKSNIQDKNMNSTDAGSV